MDKPQIGSPGHFSKVFTYTCWEKASANIYQVPPWRLGPTEEWKESLAYLANTLLDPRGVREETYRSVRSRNAPLWTLQAEGKAKQRRVWSGSPGVWDVKLF